MAQRNIVRILKHSGGYGANLASINITGGCRGQRVASLTTNRGKHVTAASQQQRANFVTTHRLASSTPKGEPPLDSNAIDLNTSRDHSRSLRIKNALTLDINGRSQDFSPIKIRDSCNCERCLDQSTRQKLISSFDIPAEIKAKDVQASSEGVTIRWENDVAGFGDDHTTFLGSEALQLLDANKSVKRSAPRLSPASTWDAAKLRRSVADIAYDAYSADDRVLFRAVRHLHKYGFAYLTGVPEDEKSVERIAERIGPLKTTFYGRTWDVRSVPDAKNVAYTSQDLGFHMDLLYMEQPPHLQLLHCIRSSSAGGASLFTDSQKAVQLLAKEDPEAFGHLQRTPIAFHYDHPNSNLYTQRRHVLEPLTTNHSLTQPRRAFLMDKMHDAQAGHINHNVFWSPPFQAPLGIGDQYVENWHRAAVAFNRLIQRPEAIYERMMKPGECVIFDNRRVLHARKAFEVADAGKERWLKGAYLDSDPFKSKLHTLTLRYGNDVSAAEGAPSGE
ncbi:hypothetical protein MBLNU230_g5735t1 [Neophaeotheca triangularis]